MKIVINVDGVDYEYDVTDKNFKKNEWPKSVDGEWCACKEAESNIEKEDYNE